MTVADSPRPNDWQADAAERARRRETIIFAIRSYGQGRGTISAIELLLDQVDEQHAAALERLVARLTQQEETLQIAMHAVATSCCDVNEDGVCVIECEMRFGGNDMIVHRDCVRIKALKAYSDLAAVRSKEPE